LTNRETKNVI